MLTKVKIIKKFGLSKLQSKKIDQYISEIKTHNNYKNIVGRSSLLDPWKSHVLDSIQIVNFIPDKQSSILDMGTGAGLPGIILAINSFKNITLIDSNLKKIKFIQFVCRKLNIEVKIYHQRIESLINNKFDYLVSRALANLNDLFFYSQKLLKDKSVLIFLKGKRVKDEIHEATRYWKFNYELHKSISDERGSVLIIKDLIKINE